MDSASSLLDHISKKNDFFSWRRVADWSGWHRRVRLPLPWALEVASAGSTANKRRITQPLIESKQKTVVVVFSFLRGKAGAVRGFMERISKAKQKQERFRNRVASELSKVISKFYVGLCSSRPNK